MAQGKGESAEKKGVEGKEQRSSQAGEKAQGPKAQQGKPGMAQGKEATEKKGAEGKEQRSTQAGEKAKGAKGAQQGKQPGMAQEKGGAQTGQSTTGQQKPSTQTQTQQGTTSKGTTSQGTTSGSTSSSTSTSGSVQLSQEQRTKVHSIVVKESSARVEHVDFSVSVGTVVPRHIKLVTLPSEVVEIVPQFRGYRFIIVRDEIVIIDPNTLRIVAVIPA